MLRATAPTAGGLAAEYRRRGFWPAPPLRDGIERMAEADGDRAAVIDNERTWTFGQLRSLVERGVGTLLAAGVEREDPVVVVAPNSGHAVAAVMAVLRANGVAVVVDRRAGPLDVANAIASSGARHVVVPGDLRGPLRVDEHDVGAIGLQAFGEGRAIADWAEPDTSLPRIVVFTSGTTRRAKGVIHSLDTIGVGADNLAASFHVRDGDRLFLSSPVATITGMCQVLLGTRGTTVILEDRFDPARSLERIEEHRATVIGGAPVILEMLFDEYARQGRRTTALDRVAVGGTMIPRSVLEVAIDRFGIRPTRAYGSSEVPIHTMSGDDDALEQRLSDDGLPRPGSEWRLGEDFGTSHELEVRGPNMFQGYLHEEDNESVFMDGWFRTGDLVEDVGGGRLRVLGRLKDVAVRKGLKISLAEVDGAAEAVEGWAEAAAYVVPDEETGERVAIAVWRPEGATVDYAAVRDALLEAGLAKGKLPEEVVVWQGPLPRNASGKIIRRDLATGSTQRHRTYAPRLRSR